MTPVLVTNQRGAPDPEILRQAMRSWAFNPPRSEQPRRPADIEAALRWLATGVSVPGVGAAKRPRMVSKALDACGT